MAQFMMFISHNMLPGVPAGREGGKVVHQGLLATFPNQHTETLSLIAEGDKVVQHFMVGGTDKGGLLGAPPTGKSYKVPGMSIFRIANGKIVEHWGVFDQMVATLTRIFGVGNLELAEDVVQETLIKALRQWPYRGVPENPGGWLMQVAKDY